MIVSALELETNHLRFQFDLRNINRKLVNPYSNSKGQEDLEASINRIDILLSEAPLEEWLTSAIESERDFALTWLVPQTREQIEKCIHQGRLISIPVYRRGKVVDFCGLFRSLSKV